MPSHGPNLEQRGKLQEFWGFWPFLVDDAGVAYEVDDIAMMTTTMMTMMGTLFWGPYNKDPTF